MLAEVHREWVEAALRSAERQRQALWTESVAVGSREFVAGVQRDLGNRGRHRAIEHIDDVHVLREPAGAYRGRFEVENGRIAGNWG